MKTMLIALGLALGTCGPLAAKAPDSDESPRAVVNYSDLDLSSSDGQAALHQRVRRAVHVLCLKVNGPSPHYLATSSCRRFAIKHARVQMERMIARAQSSPTLAGRGDGTIRIAAAQ